MDISERDLMGGLHKWLAGHCKEGSKSWQDYERAKAYMQSAGFDHRNWHYGIVVIANYLGV